MKYSIYAQIQNAVKEEIHNVMQDYLEYHLDELLGRLDLSALVEDTILSYFDLDDKLEDKLTELVREIIEEMFDNEVEQILEEDE